MCVFARSCVGVHKSTSLQDDKQEHTFNNYVRIRGVCPEDLPEAMNDWEKWRERVRDIRATRTT